MMIPEKNFIEDEDMKDFYKCINESYQRLINDNLKAISRFEKIFEYSKNPDIKKTLLDNINRCKEIIRMCKENIVKLD